MMGSETSRTMHHDPHYPDTHSVFGSTYRSPYPYYKRDYDVHKKIWDPYVNRPSRATRIFEILTLLIALAAVPCFLGGVLQVFVAFYALMLGLLGLFAWPRRHMIVWIILSLLMIALLIVSIILRSQDQADCFPFVDNDSPTLLAQDVVAATPTPTVVPHTFNTNWRGNFCGSETLTYITHGILLGLILLSLPFAIKIATERRRRFYDYDHIAPTAVTSDMPSSGHTAVYNKPPMMAHPGHVAPATPVIATPVYAASNTGSVAPPAH